MKRLQIKTAQNININFTIADVGLRLGAFFIDNLLKYIYLYFVYKVLELGVTNFIIFDFFNKDPINTILLLPVVFYSLYTEMYMNGQTVGKRLMKIKVINVDGFKPSTNDFIMRWFLRVVDFNFFSLVFIYIYSLGIDVNANIGYIVTAFFVGKLVGFLLIIFTKNNQRFGDVISNTIVINLKDEAQFSHTIIEELTTGYVPVYPNVINFSDNDMRLIKDTYNTIDHGSDFKTLIKLRTKIEEVANIKKKEISDKEFIQRVLKDYSFYTQDG